MIEKTMHFPFVGCHVLYSISIGDSLLFTLFLSSIALPNFCLSDLLCRTVHCFSNYDGAFILAVLSILLHVF